MKLSTLALFIAAFALIALVMPVVHAQDAPTVTISNYQVNPSVLMPDTKGTITITVKNTASSASVSEKMGIWRARSFTFSGVPTPCILLKEWAGKSNVPTGSVSAAP